MFEYVKPEWHTCTVCGKVFATSSKYRNTCSRECTQVAKNKHIRKKRSDAGKPKNKASICSEETCKYYSEKRANGCDLLDVAYRVDCPFLKVEAEE